VFGPRNVSEKFPIKIRVEFEFLYPVGRSKIFGSEVGKRVGQQVDLKR